MYYNYDDKNKFGNVNDPGEDGREDSGRDLEKMSGQIPETHADAPASQQTEAKSGPVRGQESEQDRKEGGIRETWREPSYHTPEEPSAAYSPNHYNNGAGNPAYNRYSEQPWEAQEPKKKKSGSGTGKRIVRFVCLLLICSLVSATAAYGVVDYKIKNGDFDSVKQVVLGSNNAGAADSTGASELTTTGSEMTASQIYDLACEQVVGIQTSATSTNIFGQSTITPAVSGSGFIISADGYIMTNYHVIEYAVLYGQQYGYSVSVITNDGTSYPAEIIGYEEDNDIAVLKIDATGLNAVTVGSSSGMSVGQTIYTVGNPLGELEYTMTSGIVSALDREITTEASVAINMFQIDAAVNSGNSGGPVYNSKGEVIGIVTAKYSSSGVEGLGFAIPINDAVNIASDLIEHGYVTGKAYIGVYVRTVTSTVAQYYNMAEGAYVDTVVSGYAAEKAGVKVSDIITKLGDSEIKSKEDLKSALRDYTSGDTAAITVFRSGEYVDLSITFDEEPVTTDNQTATVPNESIFPNYDTNSGT